MLAILAAAGRSATAATPIRRPYTVLLAGGRGSEQDPDLAHSGRRAYVIDSVVPLEVGGTVCDNPPGTRTS